jgi:hypothetical protein
LASCGWRWPRGSGLAGFTSWSARRPRAVSV